LRPIKAASAFLYPARVRILDNGYYSWRIREMEPPSGETSREGGRRPPFAYRRLAPLARL